VNTMPFEPGNQTRVLSDSDVRQVFRWELAITALREAYRRPPAHAAYPRRTIARGDGAWLRMMGGIADRTVMGAKLIAGSPQSRRFAYLIPLFEQASADLVGLLDGNAITGFRTAATSALAADLLAPGGGVTVGMIGSGFEARHHLRALASVRQIDEAFVFSPNPESRARFIADMADLPFPVREAESAEAVARASGVVICAARARGEVPILHGEWLGEGKTVVSIGSTVPEQREVATSVVACAHLIVADVVDEVVEESGDMIAAVEDGISFEEKTWALADVVRGCHPGRTNDRQTIVYKSVGSAMQDIVVAEACLNEAAARSIGNLVALGINAVRKG